MAEDSGSSQPALRMDYLQQSDAEAMEMASAATAQNPGVQPWTRRLLSEGGPVRRKKGKNRVALSAPKPTSAPGSTKTSGSMSAAIPQAHKPAMKIAQTLFHIYAFAAGLFFFYVDTDKYAAFVKVVDKVFQVALDMMIPKNASQGFKVDYTSTMDKDKFVSYIAKTQGSTRKDIRGAARPIIEEYYLSDAKVMALHPDLTPGTARQATIFDLYSEAVCGGAVLHHLKTPDGNIIPWASLACMQVLHHFVYEQNNKFKDNLAVLNETFSVEMVAFAHFIILTCLDEWYTPVPGTWYRKELNAKLDEARYQQILDQINLAQEDPSFKASFAAMRADWWQLGRDLAGLSAEDHLITPLPQLSQPSILRSLSVEESLESSEPPTSNTENYTSSLAPTDTNTDAPDTNAPDFSREVNWLDYLNLDMIPETPKSPL